MPRPRGDHKQHIEFNLLGLIVTVVVTVEGMHQYNNLDSTVILVMHEHITVMMPSTPASPSKRPFEIFQQYLV